MMVTYLCDATSKRCWLTENPDNYIKFIIPMALFGHGRIPVETKLDNISKLFSRERRRINHPSETNSHSVTTKSLNDSNPDFLRRRKREAPSLLYKNDNIQSESSMISDAEQLGRVNLWREKRDDQHSESDEIDQSTEETDTRAPRQQMKRSAPLEEDSSSQPSDSTDVNSDESSTPESSEQKKRTPQHEELYRAKLSEDDEDDSEVDPSLFLSNVDPIYKVARSNSLNYRSLMDNDYSNMNYGYGQNSHYYPKQNYYKSHPYYARQQQIKYPILFHNNPDYYKPIKKAKPYQDPYQKTKYRNYAYKPHKPVQIKYNEGGYGDVDNDMYYGY
ncbi:hypothetical protein TNIN_493361 [Trichonephila inaurata madagascariensis]|uniref:Uncharacterized protein n=1 Tax=Trichonephila inaurata madagascariensis TaxID=2747483 RepID=A0A8X6IM08_9ARAC|nr:hypothetical protein TNIN_493361 [Trichonephila inaurata madagascariensis]